MPVKTTVANQSGENILVLRFSGPVSVEELADTVTKALELLEPVIPYRSLIVFDHDAELSEMNNETLGGIHKQAEEIRQRRNLGPRKGAAALNNSSDAKIILPLYNAVNLTRASEDLGFEMFDDIQSALKYLGIPLDRGLEIISRTD